MPNLSLSETCGVTLVATALNASRLELFQTLPSVSLTTTAMAGRVLVVKTRTGEARLTFTATLGTEPEHPVLKARLYNLTGPPRDSGGAIICFVGPPGKTVEWRMVQGEGTLTPFQTYTDELGRASCRLDVGYYAKKTVIVVGAAFIP